MTSYTIRPLTLKDIPSGMMLSKIAGWNQTPDDWHMILETSQGGSFAAVVNECPVGMITTVSYPPYFSWLGMLLVQPEYRRQGIGSKLLDSAINYARDIGVVRLDATPTGKPLYVQLGFMEECELLRMVLPSAGTIDATGVSTHHIDDASITDVCLYDIPVFGASRNSILRWLYRSAPHYSFYSHQNTGTDKDIEQITGFCLGRSGSRYDQIGPIVADNDDTAYNLLLSALDARSQNSVIVDVPTGNNTWLTELLRLGFVQIRSYTRMALGENQQFGQPDKVFAIAGPEIG